MTKSIQIEELIKSRAIQHENYRIINCHPATGILYLTK